MAMVAAQFSADEAEELRRSMASWKQQGHMNQLRQKMSQNLMLKGVSTEYVERICRQIEGFGEYGFPESHAASFALIAYASAWLKHYYPAEFCCGLLNSQPMGFYQPWPLPHHPACGSAPGGSRS
jgi:error-prone DNA polymerase